MTTQPYTSDLRTRSYLKGPAMLTLISGDSPDRALEEAEASVRASVVTDYLTAIRRGDRLAVFAAEHLAGQIDASTPHGPRLLDELAGLNLPAAA